MTKKFQKKIEDFVCKNCGFEVTGSGYTNHCPECLWSKHVDVNPGDREETCQGLMKPIRIEKRKGELAILHKCVLCGHEKWNKLSSEDNYDRIIEITQ